MKAARLVVLGVALAAGGIAAYLASSHHEAPPPPRRPPPPLATVEILIAKNDLGRGQLIGEGDIGWQIWPQVAATQSFVKKTERPDAMRQFVGAIVRIPVAAGEPIRDPAVVFAKGSGFLAAVLTKGMRAVSMEVSAENGAGGFILPDDHVDVILTRRDKAAEKLVGVEKIVSEADPAQCARAGDRPGGRGKSRPEGRGRQDRDARTESRSGRDAGAVASARHAVAGIAQSGRLAIIDSSRAATTTTQRGPLNTVRYGVSTLSLSH